MNRVARQVAATMMLISGLCFAQLDRGTITGTVTDASGAVYREPESRSRTALPTRRMRPSTTGAGDYTAVNLPAGTYDLTFNAPGLKTLVRAGICGGRFGNGSRGCVAASRPVEGYGYGDGRGLGAANR